MAAATNEPTQERIWKLEAEVRRICDEGDAELFSYLEELGVGSDEKCWRKALLAILRKNESVAHSRALCEIRRESTTIREEGELATLGNDIRDAKQANRILAEDFQEVGGLAPRLDKHENLDKQARDCYQANRTRFAGDVHSACAECIHFIERMMPKAKRRGRHLHQRFRQQAREILAVALDEDRLDDVLAPLKALKTNQFHRRTLYPLIERLRGVRVKRARMNRKVSRVTASLESATTAERAFALKELRALLYSAQVDSWGQNDAIGDLEGLLIKSEGTPTLMSKANGETVNAVQFLEGLDAAASIRSGLDKLEELQSMMKVCIRHLEKLIQEEESEA